ncbi:hypothetical protein UFOVP13_1, partial [uncultured Caudovirales phage]
GYLVSYTETDPVFVASPAHSITNTNIANWNTAYGWGNHASAGYLLGSAIGSTVQGYDADLQAIGALSGTTGLLKKIGANTWVLDTSNYLISYTETDPIFVASPAYGITSINITNWNTAYSWGNHASAGYLVSYTETDPVFVASPAHSITNTNIANWNTAYGWGNHASAGYLTSSAIGVSVQAYDPDLTSWGMITPAAKQDTLVSGTNIKTINGSSVLGSGDLAISGTAPTQYYYRKNTATTLTSATGNQSVLGLTSGVSLVANTIYEVEGEFELTTTGTTSHTEAFGFTLATATVTNMGVTVNRLSANTTSSALGAYLASVTPVVVTGALTTAQTVIYRVKGSISIGTAGFVNPVIAFSAAPGGTSTVVLGARFKFTAIGITGSNVSTGTWA